MGGEAKVMRAWVGRVVEVPGRGGVGVRGIAGDVYGNGNSRVAW